MRKVFRKFLLASIVLGIGSSSPALAEVAISGPSAYTPIRYDRADETVTMTGHDLTIDQLIRVARHGAKVALSPEARQRSADAYGLLLQGSAEGVSIYWFNRGAGSQRETVIFSGDPTAPENAAKLRARQRASFGWRGGYGPEVAHEDLVRAMMAIRVNTMSYEAASPGLTQALIDLLNNRITPVVQSRGTLGEGDLAILGQVGSAMVGEGEVYYRGVRMPAAQALKEAGLKPFEPFGADDAALISTNAYAVAHAALLVEDARQLLEWTDLSTAMALLGMNSSVTPISMPVQSNRPYPWLNWDAARVMDMIRGSYLFDGDPKRIIQDPESLRASTQRAGSAWQSWAELRDTLMIAMNSSDHNPAVRPGLKPTDSWELSTPQMMRFYVKGGKLSNGKSGYIFSNANWDPYPMANQIEAFTIALANLGVAVAQRIDRFGNPFFTVVKPSDVLPPEQAREMAFGGGYLPSDLWIELAGLITPVTPQGQAIVSTVEDLQAETRLKVVRAREAVDVATHLLAQDIITASNWMEVRKAQDASRNFGNAPAAASAALRKALASGEGRLPPGMRAYQFLKSMPASSFYPGGPAQPPAAPVPLVGKR
ncbi:histidine ammonia-lyase [Sphingomonas oleivorans]|uniref:Histidine ammonia-lyase n=1 Tax=Sphingomonas oleivorans TaxID=1735121 RepID=A0A2T5G0T5_9SPHN|nr:aromatic amino acid ammonia-lyase [Sphingomonas oleivorans]PTQ12731.1 histidine ammonia-lyase [Sphingomonas oleivorans]